LNKDNHSQSRSVEHLFRHEYGKLVALLVYRLGIDNLDAIEDAVQWSMAQAIESWRKNDIPNNPPAWLYKVAYHHLLSDFQTSQRQKALLKKEFSSHNDSFIEQPEIPLSGEMTDSLLGMLFLTCNDAIPLESQLVFTLKSLCGFSIREIALRLFISEANAYKRFNRARKALQTEPLELDKLSDSERLIRLPSVNRILYLIFTEGYLSSHEDSAIRKDLCEEAIRLVSLLLESNVVISSEDLSGNNYALLALMYLHTARLDSRQDGFDTLLLLEQQDRSKWNQNKIAQGLVFLEKSTRSENISRYHIEAGIVAEHCLAKSFEQTPWKRIIKSYELLEKIAPSPMHLLNRAIATAEHKTPEAGLEILKSADIPQWFRGSYHWYAVLADLHFRCGESVVGEKYAKTAIELVPTQKIEQLLSKRFYS